MLRRILVAIDETPASRVAQDLAIAIAKQRARPSQAWGVVDRPWATAPQAIPIGGSAYKVHRAPSRRDDFGEKTAIDTSRGLCAVPPDGSR
jgi:nucleotide-binding universal stress UspA family protein